MPEKDQWIQSVMNILAGQARDSEACAVSREVWNVVRISNNKHMGLTSAWDKQGSTRYKQDGWMVGSDTAGPFQSAGRGAASITATAVHANESVCSLQYPLTGRLHRTQNRRHLADLLASQPTTNIVLELPGIESNTRWRPDLTTCTGITPTPAQKANTSVIRPATNSHQHACIASCLAGRRPSSTRLFLETGSLP